MTTERPSWKSVRASLARYDPDRLEDRVADWIDEFLPRVVVKRKGRPELEDLELYQRRLDLLLSRSLPPWYGYRGWRIANESFGGCFCHSFLGEYATEPRAAGVARAAAWVRGEVDLLVQCLREFEAIFPLFGFPSDPGERAFAVSCAIDHVFGAVTERTQSNAAWHRYVSDGVLWLFDHLALDSPPVLVKLVETSVGELSTDCVPPPLADRYRLAEDLAVIAVHATLKDLPRANVVDL